MAWEMVGEPDVGYCTDLPDRVAAFQKAVYLGLKAGGKVQLVDGSYRLSGSGTRSNEPVTNNKTIGRPIVLMGALALPPGPWLERAAANGLFDYTDAVNFHFYGLARDLPGVIDAHRQFAARWRTQGPALPLWITECGMNAVTTATFMDPERRKRQEEFTLATARVALRAPDVAVFMPFIFVHAGDGFAMTHGNAVPFPAWQAYARFTRENPWPKRVAAAPLAAPNPVVVQWLPDNRTGLAHKVSGTYRFRTGLAIHGEIRVYNFSPLPVEGRFVGSDARDISVVGLRSDVVRVGAYGVVSVPVEIAAVGDQGYFREDWEAAFVEQSGRRSTARLAFEAWPNEDSFRVQSLALLPDRWWRRTTHAESTDLIRRRGRFWREVNDLQLTELSGESGVAKLRLEASRAAEDPLRFAMAAAHVAGLPSSGFLRLQLSRPMGRDFQVRVDLVNRQGERFSIWENFGVSYYRPSADVWLNLRDFHPYFWGRCRGSPELRPEEVREIQLRLFAKKANDPVELSLSLHVPKGTN